mgnify:CR=1 FL=1
MSARPARKKSALSAGPAAVIAPPPASPAAPPVRAAAPTPPAAEMARLSIRIDAELLGQIRAAWWYTAATTGTRTMSAWVINALEAQLRRYEVEHNGGQPFSPVDAGEIPRGPR